MSPRATDDQIAAESVVRLASALNHDIVRKQWTQLGWLGSRNLFQPRTLRAAAQHGQKRTCELLDAHAVELRRGRGGNDRGRRAHVLPRAGAHGGPSAADREPRRTQHGLCQYHVTAKGRAIRQHHAPDVWCAARTSAACALMARLTAKLLGSERSDPRSGAGS